MLELDENLMRRAIEIAADSRAHGNHPFGALLADEERHILLEAENTVVTGKDCTGHAETNLMRKACKEFDRDTLAKCTIYTSTEPCPMCVGAIFWANVGKVVFGLSAKRLYEIVGNKSEEVFEISSKELFNKGKKKVEVIGPLLENEAVKVHEGFWD